MLPWGHAAVAYLLYWLVLWRRDRLPPEGWAVLSLGFGTQFPDLVDKPLAWSFSVLPAGRSLAHSTVTLAVVAVAVLAVANRHRVVGPAVAFLVGYASHIVADAVAPVSRGEYHALAYLIYPLVPLPTPEHDFGLLTFFFRLEPTPMLTLGLVLTAVALWRWYRDGTPGLAELRWFVDRLSPRRTPERSR